MKVNASQLRQDVYRLLDRVLETGQPLEVERKGRRLRIVPADTVSKLARLPKRRCIQGNPEDFVSIDWSSEWKP